MGGDQINNHNAVTASHALSSEDPQYSCDFQIEHYFSNSGKEPKYESLDNVPSLLKDLRKTRATHFDAHLPESLINTSEIRMSVVVALTDGQKAHAKLRIQFHLDPSGD